MSGAKTSGRRATSVEREQMDLEQSRVDAARRQNQIALTVAGSFPAKIRELMAGVLVPAYAGTSEAVAKQCAEHAARVDAMLARQEQLISALSDSLAKAATDGVYGDVAAAVENVRFDKAAIAQEAVNLWAESQQLVTLVVADLAPLSSKLEADAQATLEAVKTELTKMGSGLEAQLAGMDYPDLAEKQFTFTARKNTRAKNALDAAHDAREQHRAASVQAGICERGLVAAREHLHAVVIKSIQ